MMTIKKVKLSEALKKKGKSREKLVKSMSAREIKRRADSDPDNPVLNETQLEEFEFANKKREDDEKS